MNIEKLRKQKNIIAEYEEYSENEFRYEDYLTEAVLHGVRSKKGVFISATNVDWRGSNGALMADNMKEAAIKMLMNNGQCHTLLWKGQEKNTIQGVSFHHDCPTGTFFNVMSKAKAIKKGLVSNGIQ